MSGSLFSQLLAPGGGLMLIPFIKIVIGLLLATCLTALYLGVARIHMAILSFLSVGLLASLEMFQRAYAQVQRARAEEEEGDNRVDDDKDKTD
mmetsp:Transcript_13804/g.19780  ORF Transcript_13804/g.19780 Transcript_13804/m.19780 type:complete len:93 (+) Transcript_13804:159-437(+)|eukprot:CAMPEP_0172414988 /NCGR_PEP_ID=MMETSP1064-20121228/1557_1 /TAXON_ID=202472 /ORGANISM="Aulacoseira subarctica , Strain CCAP 1002/5" /LENGTH=92 /DNA_ID=CAMNT_0013151873 /DNA_START=158 /DNA_END=436 /DNA_ORIENTATION=+